MVNFYNFWRYRLSNTWAIDTRIGRFRLLWPQVRIPFVHHYLKMLLSSNLVVEWSEHRFERSYHGFDRPGQKSFSAKKLRSRAVVVVQWSACSISFRRSKFKSRWRLQFCLKGTKIKRKRDRGWWIKILSIS